MAVKSGRKDPSIGSNREAGLNDVGYPDNPDVMDAADSELDGELDALAESSEWQPHPIYPVFWDDYVERFDEERGFRTGFDLSKLEQTIRRVANQTSNGKAPFPRSTPIAWYEAYPGRQPNFHNGTSRWGIFWNEPVFFEFVVYLCLKSGAATSENAPEVWARAINEVAQIARRNIRRHERTHHAIEIVCQTMHAVKGRGPYRSPNYVGRRAFFEEILASREEMLENKLPLSAMKAAEIVRLIQEAYEKAPQSGPYAQWRLARAPKGRIVVAAKLAESLGWPRASAAVIVREIDQNNDEVPETRVGSHLVPIHLP